MLLNAHTISVGNFNWRMTAKILDYTNSVIKTNPCEQCRRVTMLGRASWPWPTICHRPGLGFFAKSAEHRKCSRKNRRGLFYSCYNCSHSKHRLLSFYLEKCRTQKTLLRKQKRSASHIIIARTTNILPFVLCQRAVLTPHAKSCQKCCSTVP